MAAKKPTTFSMRMPQDLNDKIQTYALEHSCTKAEAMSHFARAGIELEERGGDMPSAQDGQAAPAAGDSAEVLSRIEQRLDALSGAKQQESEASQAIIPVDLRDVIQTYSSEHSCSEQEALSYYARIGMQASAQGGTASSAEVAELSRRIDVLAQDNQAKGEQLRQMAEMLVSIRDYTKPEEMELEGEIAEQEAEDAEDAALTDEERQRIADEHTRRIVTDVMGDYMTRQQELASREAQRVVNAAQAAQSSKPGHSLLELVLVAVIVCLVMGFVFSFMLSR